ncbi:MAG: hypothetical protein ACOYL6_02130 [Bacteriovoracaceae bacterium]
MNVTDKLFKSPAFSNRKQDKQLFIDSFKETALHHYNHNFVFKYYFDQANIHPNNLNTENDLIKVPPMLVNIFKENELRSVSSKKIVLTLTSSGTSGQKSQMLLDQQSLDRVKQSAYKIHQDMNMTSSKLYNYLCFTYDPHVANDLGTAFTDELLTSFTGKNKVYYAIQWDDKKKDFALNEQGVLETLYQFAKDPYPTRILGFPAFLYKILLENKIKIKLGPEAWVQTGGGWKGHLDQEIEKKAFRQFISESLGLPQSNIRDMFGMVEHGIPYIDCEKGNLHIPNFSRVYIRDPKSMKNLPIGQKGLIHFLGSYNTSYPSISLLTTDWGRIGTCNCSVGGHTLEILGRAGVSKSKGCALKSLELLK